MSEWWSHGEVSDAVSGGRLVGALVGDTENGAGIAAGETVFAEGRRDALATLDGLAFHGRGLLANLKGREVAS